MRLKAVLGIKSNGNKKVKIYRIQDLDNNQIQDIPVDKIIYAVKNKGVSIEGLKIENNNLVETEDIIKIMELKSNSISLFEWCQQNGKRGQRIIEEFNTGGNFPITAKDISSSSHTKPKFRCRTCKKISEQAVNNKTGRADCKCRFCAGFTDISLQEWCLKETSGYGKKLLREYIQGNNSMSPDKILYGSSQRAYFRCSNCGAVNYEKIDTRTKRKRKHCKKCDKTGTSFSEQLLFRWLLSQGIKAENQKYFESEAGYKWFDIYIPVLNLVIEHQSSWHESEEQQFKDQLGELIAQQLGINYLEVCELDSKYYREENNWCITYELFNKRQMINKLQAWFLKNYNLQFSNIITPEVGRDAWQAKFKVKYEDSLAYRYPEVAAQFIPERNYGLTSDLIPYNSGYKFWLQTAKDKEPEFVRLDNEVRKYKKKQ